MAHFSVVIQAGGKSSRMGEDKALIPFIGEITLIEYILHQINGFGHEHLIIANNPDSYQRFGLPVFADVYPDVGALGGIYSGLFHAAFDQCVVLACDMPFVNRSLLEYLLALVPDYDVVIPRRKPKEFIEPFRAIYSKNCLEPIRNAIKDGKLKVASFFPNINVRFIEVEEVTHFDPNELTFFNINTPEELVEARQLAREYKSY